MKWGTDLQHDYKNLYVKETIILFHIECKLLQIIHTIVDISYLQ